MEIPSLNHHVGSTERVYIAHVNDLNDFYLQRAVDRDALLALGKELYEEYSNSLINPSNHHQILDIGDYCACPSESEDWYRASIRQIDPQGHAWVYKVDYGDVQCVPMQCLQPLQERFFQQPTLAFHCSLVNLVKPMQGWSSTVIDEFNSRLTTTFLYARFVYYNAMRHLSEVDLTEKNSRTTFSSDFARYQEAESLIPIQDASIFKVIPMGELNLTEPNAIRILHYLSPSRFYVYLHENVDTYIRFQKDLQQAVQDSPGIGSPSKYQPIVVQDRDAIWHRAVILDLQLHLGQLSVYFLDIGLRESVPINSVRSPPRHFFSQPAVAIPCRLFNVHPTYANEPSAWKPDDAVHEEFHQVITNTVNCQLCDFRDHLYYDVSIEIPKIGDFGTFLSEKNLVSTQAMRGRPGASNLGQSPDSGFARAQLRAGGMNPTGSQQSTRPTSVDQYQSTRLSAPQLPLSRFPSMGTRNPATQPPPQPAAAAAPAPPSSSSLNFVQPENGLYYITQVHSAGEFYGCSKGRERELQDLQRKLEDYYNQMGNDQALNTGLIMAGEVFVALQNNLYQRVTIKNRLSDTRVLVQLLDVGDELTMDTSELLQLDQRYKAVPAFAQPFRLFGYEESQNSAPLTRSLKQAILKQNVQISLRGPMKNGFYPVEVVLQDQRSVNQLLLSNGANVTSSAPINRPNPTPQQAPLGSQVFSNSNRFAPNVGQDQNQRGQPRLPDVPTRMRAPAETIPMPAGRFGGNNPPAPTRTNTTNEVPPRFVGMANRNSQQTSIRDSTAPITHWNNEQESTSNAPSAQSTYSSKTYVQQPNNNQRTGDNMPPTNYAKPPMPAEPTRQYGGGSTDESRFAPQSNERPNDNYNRRDGGFTNRGGFQNRGDREPFNNRSNYERNNDGQGSGPPEEYSRRSDDSSFRGGRGSYNRSDQDRPNSYRNQNDDRDQNNYNDNRGDRRGGGGYPSQRGRGFGGDNSRRGDFRGGRRGGGGDRDGDGRSGRGGFDNWDEQKNPANAENNDSGKTFSGFPNARTPAVKFEAGDRFPDIVPPKETFQFTVSHIETPNDLFIQSMSKEAEISKLSESLQNESKTSPELDLKSSKIDQACLGKSADGCWYRAIVLSKTDNRAKIRFVDFGDTTDVNSTTTRQLSKTHCSAAPYAYRCTFPDAKVVPNVKIDDLTEKIAGARFQGKIVSKLADNQFVLESDALKKILLGANALKLKPEALLKRIPCAPVHIEPAEHRFYIQEDLKTADAIEELVEKENSTAAPFSQEELGQLSSKSIVIAPFDEEGFYRAIIQSEEADDKVKVYFVDFGNTSSCAKTALQRCSDQLSSYAHQAKQCQFYGVPEDQLDKAFAFLQEHSDSKTIEVSIVNEKDDLLNVLVFDDQKCINEQFGYDLALLEAPETEAKNEEPSKEPAETKTEEQKQPQVDEVPLLSTNSQEAPTTAESEAVESKTDENPSTAYREGVLTHLEKSRPFVYLQLVPKSEAIIEQINQCIDQITEADKHEASYNIGDHVIAQFSEDEGYYRGRLESYSSASQTYTVYFLDFGNIDEKVPVEHLFSYSDELKKIDPQARGYLLDSIDQEKWEKTIRPWMERTKLNEVVEFSVLDKNASRVHLKIDYEEAVSEEEEEEELPVAHVEPSETLEAQTCGIEKDSSDIHQLPDGESGVAQNKEVLRTCPRDRRTSGTWSVNDSCLVSDEQDEVFRGQIIAVEENTYDVKCIDDGKILEKRTEEHLYVVPGEEILTQPPLADQCQVHDQDAAGPSETIEQTIQPIPPIESVTMSPVKNDVVNEEHQSDGDGNDEDEIKQQSDTDEKDEHHSSSDSAIADDEEPNAPTNDPVTPTEVEQEKQTGETNVQKEQPEISSPVTVDSVETGPSTTPKDEPNTSTPAT